MTEEQKKQNKKQLEILSECCSILLEEYPNIYGMNKEDLKRLVIVMVLYACYL